MPLPKFSPDQQQFINDLIREVAQGVGEVLHQKGMGGAPPGVGPAPGHGPIPPKYQHIRVNRVVPGTNFEQVHTVPTTVPQLLAEVCDRLIHLTDRVEQIAQKMEEAIETEEDYYEDDDRPRRKKRKRGHA